MKINVKIPLWLFKLVTPKLAANMKRRAVLTGKSSISKGVAGASATLEFVETDKSSEKANHGK